MKLKLTLAGLALVVLSGCSTTQGQSQGHTVIKGVNLARAVSSGSYSGQGLNERVLNCFMASVDTNNRGGPCSR